MASEEYPNGKRPTDFNDLHQYFGIEEVRRQFQNISNNNSQNFKFISAGSLTQKAPSANWIIKPYLDTESLTEIFGPPGSGKTFLALAIGLCVSSGIDFHGAPVRKSGPVFYICGEGFNGISRRLRAWALANESNLNDVPFFVSNQPAQFLDGKSVEEVISAINKLKNEHGVPVLVIVDTLNRNFGPGDENSTVDMSAFVAVMDRDIKAEFGCAVLIVHHTPLSDPDRGRGSTSLYGALDWAYKLVPDKSGIRTLSATKVKEHESPPNISFRPKIIELKGWVDEDDGKVMTSCVLLATNDLPEKKQLAKQKKLVLAALKKAIKESGDVDRGATEDEWREVFYGLEENKGKRIDTKKRAFLRAPTSLIDD